MLPMSFSAMGLRPTFRPTGSLVVTSNEVVICVFRVEDDEVVRQGLGRLTNVFVGGSASATIAPLAHSSAFVHRGRKCQGVPRRILPC